MDAIAAGVVADQQARTTPAPFLASGRRLAWSVLLIVCAVPAMRAAAQLPTNQSKANEGVGAFMTCERNAPAKTALTLSTRVKGAVAIATTGAPFFEWPADWLRVIGLVGGKGRATIRGFTDSKTVSVEVTEGFSLPANPISAKAGEWGRWPPCYFKNTKTPSGIYLYGYHKGEGHGSSTNLVLDLGQHYSVDRCSLAHDNKYWGDNCNNDHWVQYCWTRVEPKTAEEKVALEAEGTGPAVLAWFRETNPCRPRLEWIELPTDHHYIRGTAKACYGGSPNGQLIVNLGARDRVLDVADWRGAHGADVLAWPKNRGCNQRWRMIPGTGNPQKYGYEIRGLGGKCLGTLPGRRPRPGHRVRMYDCAGRYTEKWHYEHGQLRVQDRRTPRLCLDINETATQSQIIVAKCASINPQTNPRQQWRFEKP